MKTLIKLLGLRQFVNHSAVFVLVLILFSCNGRENENQNISYSENGILLARKLVSVYTEIDSIRFNQDYQSELIKILSDISPETYIMQLGKGDELFRTENFSTANALRCFEKVFIAFNLQSDRGVSVSESNLLEKIIIASKALDSVNLSETLKLKNEKIKNNVKGSKFRIDVAIFELTNLYAEFWNDESKKWILFLESHHEKIRKGIESISVNSINTEKIKNLVDEPYSNPAVLANLYKLKLINENQKSIRGLKNEIQNITDAFNLMIQVQGELMKRNRNKLKINELNSTMELLLIN